MEPTPGRRLEEQQQYDNTCFLGVRFPGSIFTNFYTWDLSKMITETVWYIFAYLKRPLKAAAESFQGFAQRFSQFFPHVLYFLIFLLHVELLWEFGVWETFSQPGFAFMDPFTNK